MEVRHYLPIMLQNAKLRTTFCIPHSYSFITRCRDNNPTIAVYRTGVNLSSLRYDTTGTESVKLVEPEIAMSKRWVSNRIRMAFESFNELACLNVPN